MCTSLKKHCVGLLKLQELGNNKIDSYFCQEKFDKYPHERTLFVKQENGGNVWNIQEFNEKQIHNDWFKEDEVYFLWVEFMTTTSCACHVVWLRRIIDQLGES
jgi:hypothetical protein